MQFPVQMSDDFRISAHACKCFQSVWLASEVLSVSYIYIYTEIVFVCYIFNAHFELDTSENASSWDSDNKKSVKVGQSYKILSDATT